MLTLFFAILLPACWLAGHVLLRHDWSWPRRIAAILGLAVVSQVYAIDSALFRNLAGPDIPAWLLTLQIWLFTALILLFLWTICLDGLRLCRWLFRRLAPPDASHAAFSSSRRSFLRKSGTLVCSFVPPAFSLGASAAGLYKGTEVPSLHRMALFLPDLPSELDGFKIAHLADIHVGPLTSINWVRAIVEITNATAPDVIALSGDLADGRWEYRVARGGNRIQAALEYAGLTAKHGVFACTGNHEYYSDYAGWMQLYHKVGIRVLHNEGLVLEHGRARLVLAGLDDRAARRIGRQPLGAEQVFAGLPGRAEGAVRVLLDHGPRRARRNARAGIDLQLSGHTHGGQCIGMDRIVQQANRGFVRGWYQVADMALYVTSGAGLWAGFPVRLGVPAEVALITLRPGSGKAPCWQEL